MGARLPVWIHDYPPSPRKGPCNLPSSSTEAFERVQRVETKPAYADVKAALQSRLEALKTCADVTCKVAEGG